MTLKDVVPMAAALTTALAFLSPAAVADDGVWKVGDSYVIRFEHLDFSRPADRQALLTQIEQAASKLCEGQRPKTREQGCRTAVVQRSLSAAPGALKHIVEIARLERDGRKQAQADKWDCTP